MSRKRRASNLEGVLDFVSLLPWWAGIAIAIAGHLVLHRMAVPVQITPIQPGEMSSFVLKSVVTTFANIGQYLVPVIGLIGAAMSFFRRQKRAALVADVVQSDSADALDGMSWREFELLVGEAYRLQGYRVLETGGGGPDGGVDLSMTKTGEKFLVQCKQWKAYKVGVDVVRALYGVMAATGAAGGFVVTSGRFTAEALAFAEGRNVRLIDGPKLFAMIKQARQSLGSNVKQFDGKTQVAPPIAATAPSCPNCQSSMVKRTARTGANEGGAFWGCATFPKCRGARPLG